DFTITLANLKNGGASNCAAWNGTGHGPDAIFECGVIRLLMSNVICSVKRRPQSDRDGNGIARRGYRSSLRPRVRHLRRCSQRTECQKQEHETTDDAHRSNETKLSRG